MVTTGEERHDSDGTDTPPVGALRTFRRRYGATVFKVVKYALFALLALNVGLFLRHATLNEALDSFGWLILLAVFEYESSTLHQAYDSKWEKLALIAAQLIGYGIALHVAVTYARTQEWLDFANAVVWLLICGAIGYDMYAPGAYGAVEWRVRNGIKMALYATLVAIAILWAIEGDLLDFYDAVLWIFCFALVELNIFKFEEEDEPAAIGPSR
jgi:hypothetical protein